VADVHRLFDLALIALIVTIVAFIARAVRLVMGSIAPVSREAPLEQADLTTRLAGRIRKSLPLGRSKERRRT